MPTFGDIQTAVSKRLLDPNNVSISSQDVGNSINDAIAYWKFRRFWFNEVADTATLTAQNGSFPYPDDFLVPATEDDGFYIAYSNQRYPIKKVTQQVYDGIFLNNGFGLPRFYARIADTGYQCYPLPDRDYTVGRHYLKEYQDLVNLTDANDFTIYADRLITLWTLADMTYEFQQDDKMSPYYRDRAMKEYNNLQVMSGKSNGIGKLTLNSILI